MRRPPGGLAAALFLILLVPTALAAASSGVQMPSCAAGPATIDGVTYGTPCADLILAPPGVAAVEAGAGDDTILAAPLAASASCPGGCHLGVGSQTFDGGAGDDVVYGERGNDTLLGGEGNDQLFGGIGDDVLRGGPGDDRLAGGFGADSIDGEGGNDYVHGDGTVDRIYDKGGSGDTLSYASGVTPGFDGSVAGFPAFPPEPEGRGVKLDLRVAAGQFNGNNGLAPFGGGNDEVEGASFETVIGSPFSDYIVGTAAKQTIFGGGGADVILGEGGGDSIDGGADGDSVDPGGVDPPDPSMVSVGLMAPGQTPYSQLYLTGSSARDVVAATYSASPSPTVTFTLEAGSAAAFDPATAAEGGCGAPSSTQLVCALGTRPVDSIVLAGMGGNDVLAASGFPSSATVVVLGGEGGDSLTGGAESEDVLVEGPAAEVTAGDTASALGGDDALLHNAGADQLFGGDGNDLFLSNSVCDGNLLNGGSGRDNASWARFGEGVGANLGSGRAGRPGSGGTPSCGGGDLDFIEAIEDLEGSNFADVFYGDGGPNQLLGHKAPDVYSAAAGADTILANSGDPNAADPAASDADPVIDCGEDVDRALVDHPQYGDATPVNCEAVLEADPNSFQILPDFPIPTEPSSPSPPTTAPAAPSPTAPTPPGQRPPDRTPPQTRVLGRPGPVLSTTKDRRRVVIRFTASEAGSRFRCRLDRQPYRACASPRAYSLAPGRHTIRIFAVDRGGNADPTPAMVRVRVRRR
jgi:Ca2+-binding RTX toxin-like protein